MLFSHYRITSKVSQITVKFWSTVKLGSGVRLSPIKLALKCMYCIIMKVSSLIKKRLVGFFSFNPIKPTKAIDVIGVLNH